MTPDLNKGSAKSLDEQPPSRPRRIGVRILVWSLLLLAVIYVGVLIFRGQGDAVKMASPARTAPGITVTTATAQKGDIGLYIDSITSQVNGVVVVVHLKEGQHMHKVDPLIDIDSRPYRATLLQAHGTLQRDENILGQGRMDFARYQACCIDAL